MVSKIVIPAKSGIFLESQKIGIQRQDTALRRYDVIVPCATNHPHFQLFLLKFLDNRWVRGYSIDAFCVIKESENYRKTPYFGRFIIAVAPFKISLMRVFVWKKG